jgi:hypothetical protein
MAIILKLALRTRTNDLMSLTTQQLLDSLKAADLRLDPERLNSWHKRGIAPGEPVGRGRARHYSIEDSVFLASLVFVTKRASDLRNSDSALFEACGPARQFAGWVLDFYKEGLDGDRANKMPMLVLVNGFAGNLVFTRAELDKIRSLRSFYATRGAMVADVGWFAIKLFEAIHSVAPDSLEDDPTPPQQPAETTAEKP